MAKTTAVNQRRPKATAANRKMLSPKKAAKAKAAKAAIKSMKG